MNDVQFLEEIDDFRNSKDEELRHKATMIFNIFIKQTSSKSIILESKFVEEISKAIENNEIQRKVFDAAEIQVSEILRSDSYRRFAVTTE